MSSFKEFENKNREIEIAPIYIRVIASVIDIVIYWMIGILVGILLGEPTSGVFEIKLVGFSALLYLAIGFFLWPISEGLYGQTTGKRFMDIKVIGNKEKEMTVGRGFIRFFLGFVDFIFLTGIVVAIFDENSNRLGDIIADTTVVKSKYNG